MTASNVRCFKHPQYVGEGTPVLSCKACCGIFISLIKAQNAQAQASSAGKHPQEWLAEKAREAQAKYASAHVSP
jgi:hypothetical protein